VRSTEVVNTSKRYSHNTYVTEHLVMWWIL